MAIHISELQLTSLLSAQLYSSGGDLGEHASHEL